MSSRTPALLEARALRKSYRQGGSEIQVLKGVDLDVRPGEFLLILGPSGSGKSTLLHTIGLMDRPTSGEVFLNSRPASGLEEPERAALRNTQIGFVFQFDSMLGDFTIAENVSLPGRIRGDSGSMKRARELLARFGIEKFADRFPQEVSGGERQRAALARALYNEPKLLLADEPTGNLDTRNGELVFTHLQEIAQRSKIAVVLVSHNEYAGRFSSRIAHLTDGAITDTLTRKT